MITIIVMLILAAVVITIVIGDKGIIARAKEAGNRYKESADNETKLLGEMENAIDKNDENYKKPFDPTEWDKTATDEDVFIWGSDDKNNENYGTVIGYKPSIANYTILRYPSRCTKIIPDINRFKTIWYGSEYSYENPDAEYMKNIQKIDIPETLVELGDYSFAGVNSGGYYWNNVANIEIPGSVKTIGKYAFESSNFKTIIINDGVENIGDYAFSYNSLLENIKLPSTLKSIDNCLFDGCTSLSKLVIPNNVTSIGWDAFNECSTLNNIIIPDSVIFIDSGAFSKCNSLTKIIIPQNVVQINAGAFQYWTSSQTIYCKASSKPSGWNNQWFGYIYGYNPNIVWGYTGD